MAVNWILKVRATEGFAGVTVIELRVAAVTVSAVEPEVVPSVALMVVDPAATVVALPCEPATLEMVATVVADEDHVTWVVTSCTVPSE